VIGADRQVTGVWLRRALLGLLTAATTGWATAQLATVLAGNHGLGWLDVALLSLFVACFIWIAFSFWAAVAGFATLSFGIRQPGLSWPPSDEAAKPLASRTAIVMAVYHEEPARTFANLQAIHESLAETGLAAAFDFYVLSDSTDPDAWVAEEIAWHEAVQRLGPDARLHYRRRRRNVAKKAGNIADFCRRWGRHYDYMVVLDADSLMDGPTLVSMARLMDANPRAGLIQAPPIPVNRRTIFARMLQFAGRVYGPIFAAGQAFWQVGDGNYWGHNAIIRVEAFRESCGLPELSGPPPFGGHIMSHDFVEAALLRRAGWSVWLVPELAGSYEEVPPTLLDYARRDHRWCQGNLQHSRVVAARGLHPVSRFHLINGIMSYLASPLWLAFLAIGLAVATVNTLFPRAYFGGEKQLFPSWPIFDAELAKSLFLLALAFLLLPRLLGVFRAIAAPRRRASQGGALRIVASAAIELVYSTLLAPAMMLLQSKFVLKTLLGRSIEWGAQNRGDQGIAWRTAIGAHWGQTLLGLAIGALTLAIDLNLFWWLSPLVLGLLLAIPIAQLSSRLDLGMRSGRLGLFLIPEEVATPRVIARANELHARLALETPAPRDGLAWVLGDPLANAVHKFLLEAAGEGDAETGEALDRARRRLAGGLALTRDEKALLLYDRATLDAALPAAA
jgi:membrane glycosyltransferase